MTTIECFLRRHLTFKEIGWTEIGEEFTRFTLLKGRWGALYLHRLFAPNEHPQCHDHPWWFVTILLRRGYWEKSQEGGYAWVWRRPGSILYRPAAFRHNVITAGIGPSWSLVLVGPKTREWSLTDDCRNPS